MDKKVFVERWYQALEAYGIPRNFTSSTQHKEGVMFVKGITYSVVQTISPNSDQRRELMKKQKNYVPQKNEESYGLRLDPTNCFLCQNVLQAIDAREYPGIVENNALIDCGENLLVPNRYPIELGHSLFVPKNHDELTNRVIPKIDELGKKIYLPEKGKTRGAVISESWLVDAIKMFDEYNFCGLKNHVLDAMSIPGHDHWHTFFGDSPTLSLLEKLADGERTPFGQSVYFAGNTPFDTILIRGKDGEKIASIAIGVLEKLERANEIFTLAYSPHHLFISPRHSHKFNNTLHHITSRVAVHYSSEENCADMEIAKEFIPLKSQFEWERFF